MLAILPDSDWLVSHLSSCTYVHIEPEKNKKDDEPEYCEAPSPGQAELQEPVVGHSLLLQVLLRLLLLVVHIREHQLEVVQAVRQQRPECLQMEAGCVC